MYILRGKTFKEDPTQKLGSGSEGSVFQFPDDQHACVKLYHPPQNDAASRIANFRARKLQTLCDRKLLLPKHFILPKEVTTDKAGKVNGFLMSMVPSGYHKLICINKPKFRQSNQIGLRWVIEFFAQLFEELGVVHDNGLIIGDVNMGCMLFKDVSKRAWVDTDSWGFDGFPCVATTEAFAHPDLYPNITPGSKDFISAKEEHDRFAFLVMMTLMAVPGAHPFRMGTHKSVVGGMNRAKAGITIFDTDVTYPPITSPEVLSDDLLSAIIVRLKRQDPSGLDIDMLHAFAEEVTTCESCGAEYHASRKHCPSCKKVSTVDLTSLTKLLIEKLYSGKGTILHLQVQGDNVRMVCRVNHQIEIVTVSTNGALDKIQTGLLATRGARYRLCTDMFIICQNPYQDGQVPLEVYAIKSGVLKRMNDLSTMTMAGESAVFDASSRFLYRIAGNMLMCGQQFGAGTVYENPIAQVYQSQSWFTADRMSGADREVLFGYDRALKDWQWFVIRGDSPGKNFQHHQVQNLPLEPHERLEDFAVYFASASVLLVRQTTFQGRARIRYSVISLEGNVVEDTMISDGETGFEYWQYLHGKCYQGQSVLHVTPEGITKQTLGTQQYTPLGETKGGVTADDRLLRFGKQILIVRRDAVLTLSKK